MTAALYAGWRVGALLDDAGRRAPLVAAFDTLPGGALRRVAGLAQLDGAAADLWEARGGTSAGTGGRAAALV